MNNATKHCGYCKTTQHIEQFKVCGKGDMRERFCLTCRVDRGWKAREVRRHRMFRGVDIDAIHRNPRWIKVKEAA
jgi:hypothetical protein